MGEEREIARDQAPAEVSARRSAESTPSSAETELSTKVRHCALEIKREEAGTTAQSSASILASASAAALLSTAFSPSSIGFTSTTTLRILPVNLLS